MPKERKNYILGFFYQLLFVLFVLSLNITNLSLHRWKWMRIEKINIHSYYFILWTSILYLFFYSQPDHWIFSISIKNFNLKTNRILWYIYCCLSNISFYVCPIILMNLFCFLITRIETLLYVRIKKKKILNLILLHFVLLIFTKNKY